MGPQPWGQPPTPAASAAASPAPGTLPRAVSRAPPSSAAGRASPGGPCVRPEEELALTPPGFQNSLAEDDLGASPCHLGPAHTSF